MACKRPVLIKNEFVSAFIGFVGVSLILSYTFPVMNFSVYITSYIHETQTFVTMYFGLFLGIITNISISIGKPISHFIEKRFGLIITVLLCLVLILGANIVFLYLNNIWLFYLLSLIIQFSSGVINSLCMKNLIFYRPKRKGFIMVSIRLLSNILKSGLTLLGEKIINPEGYTLKPGEEYYPKRISENFVRYFQLGFIIIPIGAIIFILFIRVFNIELYRSNTLKEEKEKEDKIKSNENIEIKENTNEKDEENKDINENNDGKIENAEEKNDGPTNEIIEETKNTKFVNLEDEIKKKKEKEIEENIKFMYLDENSPAKKLRRIKTKRKVKLATKTFRFWRLTFSKLFNKFPLSFIMNTGRTFGAILGINGTALQFLSIFQLGCILIFGPIMALIVDKKGPLLLLRISIFIMIIPCILLTFLTENTIFFVGSTVMVIIADSEEELIFSPLIMEIYGIQESIVIGGIMDIVSKISSIITTISGFVISQYYKGLEILTPYRIMYIVGAVCCVLSFILVLFERKKKFNYALEDSKEEKTENLLKSGNFEKSKVET